MTTLVTTAAVGIVRACYAWLWFRVSVVVFMMRHARWLSEKRLAAWLNAAHYTRPNTRTPAQLFYHLRQAPAGLPEEPAADAAETITAELLASLRARITALESRILLVGRVHGAGTPRPSRSAPRSRCAWRGRRARRARR